MRGACNRPMIHMARPTCEQTSVQQVWDINQPAPGEVERDYHLVMASNVLHTTKNIACASLHHCWQREGIGIRRGHMATFCWFTLRARWHRC